MKKNYYPLAILLALLFSVSMGAQSDQKNFINYQGVARDSDNAIMKETTLEVGIALKFGSATSTTVYEESHTVNTDANGMFSLQIGNGNTVNGNYKDLPWGQATFMAVSLNGSEVGTTEMMAVPYAITSGDADDQSASEVPYDNSVSGLTANTTQGAIDELVTGGVIDADADPTNEFQTLSFEPGTNELSLSNGNTITIPSGGTDADADPTNEIDVTTKNGLLFGDGTTVNGLMGTAEGQVPKWDNASSSWVVGIDATGGGGGSSLWKNVGADLFYDEGKVGIGITPTSQHHIHGLATGATQYTTSSSGTTISDGVHVGVTNDLDGSPIGFLQNKGDGPLQFGTNNITRMQIDKSGNLGIGVFEPQAKLHVAGNLLSEALAGVGQRNVVADANGKLVIGAGGGGSGASGLEVIEEGGRQGWRLIGRDAAQYGDIGNDATDLSESDEIYNDKGATGANSFAAGFATKASGNFSTAMGDLTAATGSMSTALGESTVASETASTALGQFTIASGQASTSMGFNTEASGYNAVAMGEGVKAESSSSLAIGRFNIGGGTASSWIVTDPLFEIGNGSGVASRNNAFTVLKNGYVGIGLEAPLAVLHVDGDIRSSDLAGVGQRNVMADAEGNLVIGAGGGVDADADPENELQDLSLSGTTLQITDGTSVDLSTILPPGGTDDQVAAEVPFDNTTSGLTATDTQAAIDELATSGLVDTDDQGLVLTGDILTIEDGAGSIDLSAYGDDGDADPTNEIDVTAETGILLGDGTNVVGLIGTVDGQVAKWNAGTNSWEAGTDATGGGSGTPTGLEALDEGSGIGWRLIGRDPSRYGNVGEDATDLSSGDSGSNTHGATGEVSTAMGEGTTASGPYATAMGYYNIASGQGSTAMGTETNASGYSSATLGDGASASGSVATAMGASTGASGDYSTAMGQGTRADAYNSTAIGRFNVGGGDENAWQSNDPLFEIGNGTFASRSNAITVLKNGNMGLGTEAPTAHLEISSTQERPFILRSTSANNYMQYITPSGFIGYSGVWSGDNDVDFGTTSINAIGKVHLTTQATPKLTVAPNGNIGIGGTSPTAKLHIFQGGQGINTGLRFTDGTANEDWSVRHGFGLSFFYGSDIRATISANNGAYIQGSDASLKTKVTKLNSVLDRVSKLRATTYRYKSDKNQNQTMGFIAQEVQPIFPELVETMGPEEILGINYAGFSVVAIRAIQEQQQIIDSQSEKIADLEERLERLEAKFSN